MYYFLNFKNLIFLLNKSAHSPLLPYEDEWLKNFQITSDSTRVNLNIRNWILRKLQTNNFQSKMQELKVYFSTTTTTPLLYHKIIHQRVGQFLVILWLYSDLYFGMIIFTGILIETKHNQHTPPHWFAALTFSGPDLMDWTSTLKM